MKRSTTSSEPWIARADQYDDDVTSRAHQWLASPSLRAVMHSFGVPVSLSGPSHIAAWASSALDTRGGGERQQAPPVQFSEEQLGALVAAAPLIGLPATPPPTANSYDLTVILGGTTTANRLRTALARQAEATAKTGMIVALGSARPLTEAERSGSEATNEWRDLEAVVRSAFGHLAVGGDVSDEGREAGRSWVDRRMASAAGTIRVMCAPSSKRDRRADTSDAISFMIQRLEGFKPGRVLLVTSSIYASYTFFLAVPLMLAGFASDVEVVGTAATVEESATIAQRVAQELNSTIQAIAQRVL